MFNIYFTHCRSYALTKKLLSIWSGTSYNTTIDALSCVLWYGLKHELYRGMLPLRGQE